MHSSRFWSLALGLVSSLLLINVAVAAPLAFKLPLAFDVDLNIPCLLDCNTTTALSVMSNLNTKVSSDLSAIASLSGSASVDVSGLTDAYNDLVNDVNSAVDDLAATTAITLDATDAMLNAVGRLTGNILVDTMSQVRSDLSIPNIDATLASVNDGLVGLINKLNIDVGAAVMPLIANTTASLATDVQIGSGANIFAGLWAALTSSM